LEKTFEGLIMKVEKHQTVPNSEILRLNRVKSKTGLGRSTIYNHIKEGHFPKPIKLGISAVGWLENEIEEWIASQVKNTRGGDHG